MGCTPIVILLCLGLSPTLSHTLNDTQLTTGGQREASTANTTRRGRHIEEVIQVPLPGKKIKRQIIKIPPSVSKVKLVQPPLNLRHNRAPQQFNRYPPIFRSGGPWRAANKISQGDSEFEGEGSFPYDLKKVKRTLKKPIVKEVSPEEFYRNEEHEEERKHRQEKVKKPRQPHKVVKIKRKRPKQNVLGEYLVNYEGDGAPGHEGGGHPSSKLRYEENQSFYGADPAGSSIHMQQVPPPNLFLQDPPHTQVHPTTNAFEQFYDGNYPTGLIVKKLPTSGRQIQAMFSQQYTTHNPQVTTNFGLSQVAQINGLQYGPFMDAVPRESPQPGRYHQQVPAASEQVVTALPVNTPGIQVIQPPRFRDVTSSHPSHPSRLVNSMPQQKEETSSQKATIRDILEQDCPAFDTKGYCDSPPRYPMQQIKKMVKKCADLMEAMNTQPFDESQDAAYEFDKRSDDVEEKINSSVSLGAEPENLSSWSRSGNDGLTACLSDLELIEPGYAKEVNSGRWFVIVQHPVTTIQRIASDICRNPSKSCGGLSEMKCAKGNGFLTKSTRCVQQHTFQRLISWDPEMPDECPRMRVFRFPSACVCHLGVI